MKTIIVGGNFDNKFPKSSNIVNKITNHLSDTILFDNITLINGGILDELPRELNYDLSIWMPNIDNENIKHYPIKKKGSVLICSKVMRDGYKDIDAVSRIFKMRGNAVIAIYTNTNPYSFRLIDALGNEWYSGSDIKELVNNILIFYNWTNQAIRINTISDNSIEKEEHPYLNELIQLNNKLSNYIQTSCGERFFGNISTRCQKLFPSVSGNFGIYVSPRNSNKELLTADDMVYMTADYRYKGNFKPSVDSPCQIKIYNNHPEIHYMIHGHAFIKDAITTDEYYLCGDVREADEVSNLINDNGVINLKNHGFLIYAKTINDLSYIIDNLIINNQFTYNRK